MYCMLLNFSSFETFTLNPPGFNARSFAWSFASLKNKILKALEVLLLELSTFQ